MLGFSLVSPVLFTATSTKLLDRFALAAKNKQRISFSGNQKIPKNRFTMVTRSGAGKKAAAKTTSKKSASNTRRANTGKAAPKKSVSTKNNGKITRNPYNKNASTAPAPAAKENRKFMKSLSLLPLCNTIT